jgi:hypothetical protein
MRDDECLSNCSGETSSEMPPWKIKELRREYYNKIRRTD